MLISAVGALFGKDLAIIRPDKYWKNMTTISIKVYHVHLDIVLLNRVVSWSQIEMVLIVENNSTSVFIGILVSGVTENIRNPCKVRFGAPSRISQRVRAWSQSGLGPNNLGAPHNVGLAGVYVTPLVLVTQRIVEKDTPGVTIASQRIILSSLSVVTLGRSLPSGRSVRLLINHSCQHHRMVVSFRSKNKAIMCVI
ncbi:hypothetical protein TNCV_1318961 [Trichonephila clavipes]|nr:hypothetical protein TNCV_1318961 [Trichonephila clavipes]